MTRGEAAAFRSWLASRSEADRRRANFVAFFTWYDARSKEDTEDIPPISIAELEDILSEYFPEGEILW